MDTAGAGSPWDFLLMRTDRLLAELETLRHQIACLHSNINELVERFDLVGSWPEPALMSAEEEEDEEENGAKKVFSGREVIRRRLEEMETVKFGAWCEREEDPWVCTVCMERLGNGSSEAKRLACSHMYHRDCIGGWITHKNLCPLCRARVY